MANEDYKFPDEQDETKGKPSEVDFEIEGEGKLDIEVVEIGRAHV